MERIWLKHYPAGVPADIDPAQYSSLVELLEESFKTFAARKAFICMDKAISYRELDEMSTALAAYLQGLGLQKGARVALMMPNVLQYPVAISAVLRAGFTVVNVNPLYTPRELEHQLKDSGAEAIIVLENFAHTVQQVIGRSAVKHVVVASMGDLLGFKGVIVNLVVRRVKKMVPAYALPGAVRVQRRRFGRPEQALRRSPRSAPTTSRSCNIPAAPPASPRERPCSIATSSPTCCRTMPGCSRRWPSRRMIDQLLVVCALPLYHIFALTACFLLAVRAGGANLLIPNPRDIPGFIKELTKYQVNNFPAVNTLYNALLHHPDFKKRRFLQAQDLQRRRHGRAASGGRAVAAGDRLQHRRRLRPVGDVADPDLQSAHGNRIQRLDRHPRAIDATSRSATTTAMKCRSDSAGEICAKGPQVMAGYWNRPDETAKVMTADGYFRTGDIGIMSEDGYTKIVDRKKDMILVSGFNVYPNEVEEVIVSHPGVLEAAVIGLADAKSGEVVKAFIVRKDPNLSAEDVIKFCHAQLTNYKVPKQIEFRTELPKTNVGKILRRQLRDENKPEAA